MLAGRNQRLLSSRIFYRRAARQARTTGPQTVIKRAESRGELGLLADCQAGRISPMEARLGSPQER